MTETMLNLEAMKADASHSLELGRFAEALLLYETLWKKHRAYCTEWQGWGYARCLLKTGRYQEALDVCREAYRIKADFPVLNNTYAWAIYYLEIKSGPVSNEATFLRAAEGIVKLTTQEDIYSPYTRTVFKVLDYLHEKVVFDADKLLYWTGKLNPDLLSEEVFNITSPEGKPIEIASEKEKYYSIRTKALLECKQYEACISTCREALEAFEVLHYNNQTWFNRRIALAKAALGELDEAAAMLQDILKKRQEWYIQHELATVWEQMGKTEDALKMAAEAAQNFGDPPYKINLYKFMGQMLAKLGKPDIAARHIKLLLALRKDQSWKIDEETETLLKQFDIDSKSCPDAHELLKTLQKDWSDIRFGQGDPQKGIIAKLLPEGHAGFIKTENGHNYYFSIKQFKGRPAQIREGLEVEFFLADGFDKKKNEPTKVAVQVQFPMRSNK